MRNRSSQCSSNKVTSVVFQKLLPTRGAGSYSASLSFPQNGAAEKLWTSLAGAGTFPRRKRVRIASMYGAFESELLQFILHSCPSSIIATNRFGPMRKSSRFLQDYRANKSPKSASCARFRFKPVCILARGQALNADPTTQQQAR